MRPTQGLRDDAFDKVPAPNLDPMGPLVSCERRGKTQVIIVGTISAVYLVHTDAIMPEIDAAEGMLAVCQYHSTAPHRDLGPRVVQVERVVAETGWNPVGALIIWHSPFLLEHLLMAVEKAVADPS